MTRILHPCVLSGGPRARGLGQAHRPGVSAEAVRSTVAERRAGAAAVLETPDARRYLERQRAFAERECGPEFAEFLAVCEGFGIDPGDQFALFHLSILNGRFESDGCSSWARPLPDGGAILAKNRDLSGPHRNWQETFLHMDPDAAGGAVFCLGTLGVPGAYSSGMNEAGFALADTAIGAPVHGVGWLRYFLMTRLLATCRSVAEACDVLARARHAGGGSLILADASGEVAAAELLHDGARIDRASPALRSNHFWCEDPAAVAARLTPPALRSTLGRRETLTAAMERGVGLSGAAEALDAMADHGRPGVEALCRHGGEDGAHTVSGIVFQTSTCEVLLARGAPCEGTREAATIADMVSAAGHA